MKGVELKRLKVAPDLITTLRLKGMVPAASYDPRKGEIVLYAVPLPPEALKQLDDARKPKIEVVGASATVKKR